MVTDPTRFDMILDFLIWAFNLYPALGVLVLVIMIDVITGTAAAFVTKKVNSAASWRGMVRKVVMLFIVAFAALINIASPLDGFPLTKMVCLAFTVTEGISIMENAAVCGVPMPKVLIDRLKMIQESERHPVDSDHDVQRVQADIVVKRDDKNKFPFV